MARLSRIPAVLLPTLAFLVGAMPARAAWIKNGDSLCTAAEAQTSAQAVTDGAGGAIVVWRDHRNEQTGADLHARSISATGTVRWAATGVPVCVAPNDQTNQQITTDGKGGAIVVWEDSRKTPAGSAIYAQRIRANGNPAWTLNGVVVDTTSGYQTQPSIISDGAGGAIVAWTALRSELAQIYAQRLDSTGTAVWTAGGVPVAPTLTDETGAVMTADGSDGAFLAWSGATAAGSNSIHAQRITSAGVASPGWSAAGVLVADTTESPSAPAIALGDSGGAVVTWEDYRDQANTGVNIYAQRIAADGTPRWTSNGVPVCTFGSDQNAPEVVTDSAGGAIIAWQDSRTGAPTCFAQRLAADGTPLWTMNGISLCPASGQRNAMNIVPDGVGGAIAAWMDYRAGVATHIYAQRVSTRGTLLWGIAAKAVCDTTNDQQAPTLVSDGASGAVIAWHDNRNSAVSNYDIYAQHVNALGSVGGPTAVDLALPGGVQLEPPHPNPAAGLVGLVFRLSAPTSLEVTLYDIAGRAVRRLARGETFKAGAHTLHWDGRNDTGALLAPGLYFVVMQAGAGHAEAKIVRVR